MTAIQDNTMEIVKINSGRLRAIIYDKYHHALFR
jgi:hypothetical protein